MKEGTCNSNDDTACILIFCWWILVCFVMSKRESMSEKSYSQIIKKVTQFILACYDVSDKSKTEAIVESWKMKRSTLELQKPTDLS